MSRQLRPRKTRPSYSALAGFEIADDGVGVPSIANLDDASSGSDFAPGKDTKDTKEDETDELDEDDDEDDMNIETEVPEPAKPKNKPKARSGDFVVKPKNAPRAVGGSRRQMYVLPAPSVNHRHRAVPLYARDGQVERLVAPPKLFAETQTTLTNNFTHNVRIADRVNKAWGYNVGAGPLWELTEDRGWFKEGVADAEVEADRRPIVYRNVKVKKDLQVLSKEDAAPYLPSDTTMTEEGALKPPPPVPCFFGPFNSQTRVEMALYETRRIAEFIPESKSYVFNPGAPAWGLDCCPIHPDDRPGRQYKQYLAVAPFPTSEHSPEIGVREPRPLYACIQIWSLTPEGLSCELVVCIDSGPAHELKWCPLPSHDTISACDSKPRKLGLLAGTFEDGSFSVFTIPDPGDFKRSSSDPVFVRIPQPVLRIELAETACWTFDWANSEVIAIGTANGIIAVYNIGVALKSMDDPNRVPITDLLPTHYISVHQSAIRALAWIRAPPCAPSGTPCIDQDPTVIASGGYDGMECMTDIRDGRGSVMNRTRDVINTMAFSPFAGGPITIDHENIVKAYSASPSMLGRGHTLMEPQGPVWCLSASDYHPQLAVASADGACSTTNMLSPSLYTKYTSWTIVRKLKEYRMLERFLPQEIVDRTKNPGSTSIGSWSREVGIQRVVWNEGNGLASAGMLASATASGLCRIDFPEGRWMKGKIPRNSVENIRGEDEEAMEGDSDDSS
ncbi:hypothetical protein EDD18DRAFT_1309270 [Armillaria luteobubalina]|uniref:Transcription factor tau subunit sfc6 n=1 Tax=Armillaria luteobubalina TaxID=153913 RepID=A0AA39UTH7_9AGAR|nr:hypothetical protein EDD18DRAFT_1309270 [Armillaria luteobubalina]